MALALGHNTYLRWYAMDNKGEHYHADVYRRSKITPTFIHDSQATNQT